LTTIASKQYRSQTETFFIAGVQLLCMATELSQHVGLYKCDCGETSISQEQMRDHIQSCESMPHVNDD